MRHPLISVEMQFMSVLSFEWTVMCVACTFDFSPLSTSFISDTLNVILSSYVGSCGTRVTGCHTSATWSTHGKRMTIKKRMTLTIVVMNRGKILSPIAVTL